MGITVRQIKAARALLEWRQEDLSVRSGISLATINKLEREIGSPRAFTLDILQKTFQQNGVEFTEGPGVRLSDGLFSMQVLDGKHAVRDFLNDIFNTLKETGGEVLLSGIDESRWDDYADLVEMQRIRLEKHNVVPRLLIREGDTNFLGGLPPRKHYRWISKELFTQMPYYVYGNNFAVVMFGKPMRIVILRNQLVAETFRRQFEMNWKSGKLPKV